MVIVSYMTAPFPKVRPRSVMGASREEGSLSPPPLKKRKFESTTTSRYLWRNTYLRMAESVLVLGKAIASFFTPTSKKDPEKIAWRVINRSLLLAKYSPSTETTSPPVKMTKIAAFDLVGHCGFVV